MGTVGGFGRRKGVLSHRPAMICWLVVGWLVVVNVVEDAVIA
jgi:hypothetical protein